MGEILKDSCEGGAVADVSQQCICYHRASCADREVVVWLLHGMSAGRIFVRNDYRSVESTLT